MDAVRAVKILGSDITIEMRESLLVDNEPAMGSYEQEMSLIVIKDNMSESSTRDTLMHEILHAILQHYAMDSEKLVRIITPALISLLRDNPDFVSLIMRGTGYWAHPAILQPQG